MIELNKTYRGITSQFYFQGNRENPDSVTATLYRNDSATGETVTITAVGSGYYQFAFTTLGTGDGWAVTDDLLVRTVMTKNSIDYPLDVWSSTSASQVSITTAQVKTQVDTALADINLDHLVGTATGIPSVPAGTFLDQIMDDGTATFDRTTDSLQAIRDRGDSAWATAGGGATAAEIDSLLSANHGGGSWATGGTVVRLAKPVWTASGFDRPLTRGDDYSIAGLSLEVTVENWTGPDFSTASAITMTGKLYTNGVLTDTFTCNSTSATESGTTWTIVFQPTSTDTDVTVGQYDMDIQATFSGKPYTFVGPGIPLIIKQDQTT